MLRRLLLCCLLFVVYGVSAESVAPSDKTTSSDEPGFAFEETKNVSYMPVKLDQTVDPLQTLDIYTPTGEQLSPVILYVHGGGWAFGDKKDVNLKPHYFTLQGFALVSMNYRLRWDYKVYHQVVDIVKTLRWLQEHGAEHGLDGSRVVLMGHAAGGHLVSLAMSDSSYLRAEGLNGAQVKAVVSIDSISYDIPRLMRELGSFVERRQHELIFTAEEDVWQAASPITHVAQSEKLPAFALLFNPDQEASALQARGFAKRLREAEVQVVMIPGSKDAPTKTDEMIGVAGHIPTIALIAFIRSQI